MVRRPSLSALDSSHRRGRTARAVLVIGCTGILLALGSLLPATAAAQTVRGRMLESATGIPVPGALIELRDARDSVVRQALTDDGGRFTLEAPRAGRYRLHAERIGFRDWDSEPFDLAAGKSVTRTIQVATQAVSVSDLSVRAERKCRLAKQQGIATELLWEEVQKALRITLLSGKGENYQYVKRDYKRDLDVNGHKVRSEQVEVDTTFRRRPYTTLPADVLARDGFVSGDIETGRTYYAPSVETLLAEPFVQTHCIQVSGDREVDGERWVGLAFEPVGGRSLPDVAGTLWLAADGSELREMDFRYVNVEVPVAPQHRKDEGIPGGMLPTPRKVTPQGIGGKVAFTRLPSGRWIIKDWRLTLPLAGAVDAWWNPTQRYAYVLTGLHQEGGEVLQVRSDSGRSLFNHQRATLTGFVADSTRGAPLAGAVVRLEGTPYADTTNENGAFTFDDLPDGTYTVSFADARLDSLGVAAPKRVVKLTEGSVTRVALAVPSLRTRLASGCPTPAPGGAGATANLVGVLRDEKTRVPLPFANLALVRGGAAEAGGAAGAQGDILAQTRSNGEGAFRLCGVPAAPGLGLAIRFPGRPPATLRLDLSAGGTLERDITVPTAVGAGISGRVVSEGDGRPLAGASVRVSVGGGQGSPLEAKTGNDGKFGFGDVAPGRHEVRVELAGYGPAIDTVSLGSGEGLQLEVKLPTHVVSAPPIQVVVMRPEPTQGLSRRSRRLYELNTPKIDTLLKRVASTADLLRSLEVPGLLVEPMEAPKSTAPIPFAGAAALPAREGLCVSTTRGHGETSGFGSTSNRSCRMVKIYVDDAPLTPDMAYTYLEDLDPTTIARIQFVPAVDAGARYGTGSENGVLLIYTRAGEAAREHGSGGG